MATVARCRELGWVGDVAYARERARSLRARGHGALRIESELMARGLAETLIAEVIEASREGEPELVWARRALRGERDPVRAWRRLVARGFTEEVASELLDDLG